MTKKYLVVVGLLAAGTTLGGLAACGADSQTVTVLVSAAAGGTVEDKAGNVKLSIPPDALSSDTDITLKIIPKTGGALADFAEFGPAGLHFFKPATLEWKGDATLVPQGKYLAIGVDNGGSVTTVPGPGFADGVAKANIDHLGRFTLVTMDWLVDPATCAEGWSKFVPCGGDPTGTWLYTHTCINLPVPADTLAKCPQFTGTMEYANTSEVTFDATTMAISSGTTTSNTHAYFPLSCPMLSDGGVGAACSDYSGQDTCSDTGGGQCDCASSTVYASPAYPPSAFKRDGTTWSNDTGSSSGDFCVSGDILYYDIKDADGGLYMLYVLSRKK